MENSNTKVVNTFKYGASSIFLGGVLTTILIHYVPDLQEINEAVQGLITFAINLALVKSGLISDE